MGKIMTANRLQKSLMICVLLLTYAGVGKAEIYRYKDASGITVLTSVKPRVANYAVYDENCDKGLFGCVRKVKRSKHRFRIKPTAYRHQVLRASSRFGVDSALIRAVMHAESAFKKNAISKKGAMGLMQLMPATAERFGVKDVFNAEQNINGGTRYLRYLLKMFNDDIVLASAAYNAGENAVKKYNGVPPYPETRNYVSKVARLHRAYKYAY
jgi:soluble lytic murein transglycosylase-like protein